MTNPNLSLSKHKLSTKFRYNIPNAVLFSFRLVVSIILLIGFYLFAMVHGKNVFIRVYTYLSQWAIFNTIIYFILNLVLFVDKKPTTRLSTYFSITLCLNLMVFILFFVILFPRLPPAFYQRADAVEFLSWLPFRYYVIYYVHAFPLMFTLLDFCFNKIYLTSKGFSTWLSVQSSYLLVNAFNSLVLGITVYPMLNYKDRLSYILIIVTLGLASVVWYIPVALQKFKLTTKIDTEKRLE